jgi:hypothetical protein
MAATESHPNPGNASAYAKAINEMSDPVPTALEYPSRLWPATHDKQPNCQDNRRSGKKQPIIHMLKLSHINPAGWNTARAMR